MSTPSNVTAVSQPTNTKMTAPPNTPCDHKQLVNTGKEEGRFRDTRAEPLDATVSVGGPQVFEYFLQCIKGHFTPSPGDFL